MQQIRPCLWFDGKAEEAANFYVSVFDDAKILDRMYYGEAGPGQKGSVLTVTFELRGQEFIALNGGPHYTFSPAISLFVTCRSQAEVDEYWEKLSVGGATQRCGWLTDKYGVSWQIVPAVLGEMPGHGGHAHDDQARHRAAARRLRAGIAHHSQDRHGRACPCACPGHPSLVFAPGSRPMLRQAQHEVSLLRRSPLSLLPSHPLRIPRPELVEGRAAAPKKAGMPGTIPRE
jgi:predicted 3-demethylubiquinone-9 3-methyltransferase (glyoxalase superfamily)